MRIVVDRTLCESNAKCARLVPEVFEIGDDDELRIKQDRPVLEALGLYYEEPMGDAGGHQAVGSTFKA